MRLPQFCILLALTAWTACAAVIVQLRVLEGEGGVYPIGSRATRGLTVQVTDETGKPVDGATVSFRLPEQGPGGAFSGGLRTDVTTTHSDGKATAWGMQWNKTPGPFEIRITAVKDQARAGVVSAQYLSDAAAAKSGGTGTFHASRGIRSKWLILGAAIAAGAGAGIALGAMQSKTSVSPITPTQIGNPSILIGGPK